MIKMIGLLSYVGHLMEYTNKKANWSITVTIVNIEQMDLVDKYLDIRRIKGQMMASVA